MRNRDNGFGRCGVHDVLHIALGIVLAYFIIMALRDAGGCLWLLIIIILIAALVGGH